MRLNVYTIFDSAAGAYMRPFFMQSDGQALRSFTDIATDKDHEIGKHPEDYSLYRIELMMTMLEDWFLKIRNVW